MKNFNIYTAIAYTSAKPHIGNTYEAILADAIARFKRLEGFDVYYQTGTDEHGQKIEEKANEKGITPQKFVDGIASEIKEVWDVVNTSYDKFVRTTDVDHKEKVAQIFKKLYDQGDIYKGHYEGLYCTPCESFFTETQLVDGKCPDCGREVTETKEEAYFLKLSNYTERLKKHIEENPEFIVPESRKNEIVNNFIKPGLEDLCVSRTSFKWGVPVSFDDDHVTYVWIDALSNYITFPGYEPNGENDKDFSSKWPADVHIIGKDILRFHTIYWIVLLMALELPLPKKIFGHPWVLSGNDKMSKSLGNIIYADDLVEYFGVDAVRYYFLSQISFANDGLFTYELFIDKFNSELANNLGNLVNRTISMTNKYFDGIVYPSNELLELDESFRKDVLSYQDIAIESIDKYKVADSINSVFKIFDRANKYIDETTPWILAKDENQDRLKTVMYNLVEAIRHGAVLLQAFLPDTAEIIFEQLNTDNKSFESIKEFAGIYNNNLNKPTPIFVRIDKEEKLKEIVN